MFVVVYRIRNSRNKAGQWWCATSIYNSLQDAEAFARRMEENVQKFHEYKVMRLVEPIDNSRAINVDYGVNPHRD